VVLKRLEEQLPVDFACLCRYDAGAESLTIAKIGSASSALATQLGLAEQATLPIDQNGLARCIAGELVYEDDTGSVPFPLSNDWPTLACAPW